ncbi:MAG: S8 family peptidase [Candidatus Limimorpha sp.]
MRKIFLLFLLCAVGEIVCAQISINKYWIQFTDKDDTPYSVDRPREFLSARAIERRARYGVAIDELDIPVNESYINAVAECGATVLNPSKWLNGVTVEVLDDTVLEKLKALPFVDSMRRFEEKEGRAEENGKFALENKSMVSGTAVNKVKSDYYGYALTQIEQLNGIGLHDAGYTGNGILIGICDGGFSGAEELDLFEPVRNEGRLLGTKDFVGHESVYNSTVHGTSVWGIIAGKIPDLYVGTAPDAYFYLCKTENTRSETLIEEYNWVSAAEHLDSLGVDVINTSLSYVDFDNFSWDHSYSDMDGNTCVITIGAEIACSRGILCVNSAGNNGELSWHWIGAPADGETVFTIGSVNNYGERSAFSSVGPTYDGRIKPDVMALGERIYVTTSTNNEFLPGSGTSYSSPVMAGIAACLMQAMPNKNPVEIVDALRKSADRADNPDSDYGYGIPDAAKALALLSLDELSNDPDSMIKIFPNPSNGVISSRICVEGICHVQVFDCVGKCLYSNDIQRNNNDLDVFLTDLGAGMYLVNISNDSNKMSMKIIKY